MVLRNVALHPYIVLGAGPVGHLFHSQGLRVVGSFNISTIEAMA